MSPQRVQARVQLREQRAPGSGPVQGNVPVRLQVRAGPRGPGARGGRGPAKRVPLPASPRKDAVSVVDTYQYPDPEDAFSREPFVVKFSAPGSGEVPPPTPRGQPAPRLLPLTRASRSCGGVRAHPAARGTAPGRSGDRRSLRRVPGRDRQVGHGRKPRPRPGPMRACGGLAVPVRVGVRGRARAQPRLRGPHRTCCSWATSTLTATT